MAKKEMFTQDEIGIIITSFNAKIRELEAALKNLREDKDSQDKTFIVETERKLSDVMQLQEKAYRMYKF